MGHFVSYLQVIHSSNMTWCFNYKSKLFVVLVMGFVVSSLITVNAAPTEKSVTQFGDKGITGNQVKPTETPVTSPETPDTSTEPVTSSETPATSTEPVTSSETPVTSTETPVTSSETPDTSSGTPVTSTETSVTSTETPVTSTETSVTSTQKPVVTTSGAPSMGATLSALVIVVMMEQLL